MKDPIFRRDEFTLCDVPVPKGYPQSQTHSGVAIYDGFFFLTTSPYPARRYKRSVALLRIILNKISFGFLCKPLNGEAFENPCLYVGVKDAHDNSDVPVHFIPMTDNPLMDTPERYNNLPAFNSDPDIFLEHGMCYILNRSVFRTKLLEKGYESLTKIYLISGEIKNGKYRMYSNRLIKEWNKPYASPCLTKYQGEYIFMYIDTNSAIDAETFNGIYMQRTSKLSEISNANESKKIKVNCEHLLPWHMSVFHYSGVLYSIIACVIKGDQTKKIWQMIGVFNRDLSELTILPKPLTDYNSYRGSACVNDGGLFILYSTTVMEQIPGSKAVDGRNVIMASMPFSELLCKAQSV